MTEKILIIFALFLVFSSLTFSQVFSETIHTFEYTKIGCDMLAIDQTQSALEEKKWIKTTLAECVERGLITSELVELGATVWGHSTRELSIVYGLTHGDIEKTIQLLQDPNYPINVFGSPYKQVSIGIEPENVLCKDGLVLIQKYDGSPACVKPETVQKLVERGWTTLEIILNIPNSKLGVECGHYSMNEFMNRMQNHTIDKTCHDFIIEKAVEHDKEMTEKGYHFADGVWKKSGYPDVLPNLSDYYMLNSEQKK